MTLPDAWEVIYYETEDGKCPVESFIDNLQKKEQEKVMAWIALLEDEGINLHRPYADFLRDDIHELRVKTSQLSCRILYFFCHRNQIVLTHGFKKRVRKVPETEIARAVRYREEWLGRNEA